MSSDGDAFKVSREVAEQSEAVRHILADTSDDSTVPLMNVRSSILQKVITYCEFCVNHSKQDASGKSTKTVDEVRAKAWRPPCSSDTAPRARSRARCPWPRATLDL